MRLAAASDNTSPHGKGNSFKVQIYSPFIVVNKTGLPFEIRAVAKMSRSARDLAGESRPGKSNNTLRESS